MNEIVQFAAQHGYLLLFAFVLAEQIGFPLPSIPVLLAGGALVSAGHLQLGPALLAVMAASLLADLFWFELGRRKGARVLGFLCRLALEADSCVRRTENMFQRHGAPSLLVAKFVPGFNTAAPPLAGAVGMKLARFMVFSAGGALLWAGAFTGLGWLFADQLERAAQYAVAAGNAMVALVVVGGPLAYIAWKMAERKRFFREHAMARITPEELHEKMLAGEPVVFIDLRHALDLLPDPRTIPGALRIEPEELPRRYREIPADCEIVLACT